MNPKYMIAAAIATLSLAATTAAPPRLTINIVMGTMRASDIERYSANMTDGGLRRLAAEGVVCRNASYDYRSTTTPVSLATLSTGAQPCVHGVIGDSWYDYADNSIVGLIDDDKEQSVKYSTGSGSYSPRRLIAPTLGDALAAENEHSKIVTILSLIHI